MLFSCNNNNTKSDDNNIEELEEVVLSNEELIIGKWKMIIYNGTGIKSEHTFNEDGSYTFKFANEMSGTWEITNNHIITYTDSNMTDWGKIVKIDEASILLKNTDNNSKTEYVRL